MEALYHLLVPVNLVFMIVLCKLFIIEGFADSSSATILGPSNSLIPGHTGLLILVYSEVNIFTFFVDTAGRSSHILIVWVTIIILFIFTVCIIIVRCCLFACKRKGTSSFRYVNNVK